MGRHKTTDTHAQAYLTYFFHCGDVMCVALMWTVDNGLVCMYEMKCMSCNVRHIVTSHVQFTSIGLVDSTDVVTRDDLLFLLSLP